MSFLDEGIWNRSVLQEGIQTKCFLDIGTWNCSYLNEGTLKVVFQLKGPGIVFF